MSDGAIAVSPTESEEIAIAQMIGFCRRADYPYAEPAAEHDLPPIAELGQLSFGEGAFSIAKFRSLIAVNSHILWKVRGKNNVLKGYMDLMPLREDFAHGLKSGVKRESDVQPSDLLSESEIDQAQGGYIYLAAVVVDSALKASDHRPTGDRTFAKLMATALDRMQLIRARNPKIANVLAISWPRRNGRAGEATPYLERLGFKEVGCSGEGCRVYELNLDHDTRFTDVFLEISRRRQKTLPPPKPPSPRPTSAPSEAGANRLDTVLDTLKSLDSLDLGKKTVVGDYRRFDAKTISGLRDWAQRIKRGLITKTKEDHNFLIWAAPGTGKSFFIQQIAASLGDSVIYSEINFAALGQPEIEQRINDIKNAAKPVLVLYDEIDARANEKWPYDVAFSVLELNKKDPSRQAVFVLIGSTPPGRESMIAGMKARFKGQDLLDRVPAQDHFDIPPMSVGDRIIVVATQIGVAARAHAVKVDGIDKFAVYFALSERFQTPRQISQLISPAVGRMPREESVLHYTDLFVRKDVRAQDFWAANKAAADALKETHLDLMWPSA
jgi:hypothetical protein